MSLTAEQLDQTRQEMQANFALSGLTREQAASDLKISLARLDKLLALTQKSYNDPFILRDYLREKIIAAGKQPIPFSFMGADIQHYWFLDVDVIKRRQMSKNDD